MKLDLSGLEQFKASSLLRESAPPCGAPVAVALSLIDFDPKQPRRTIDESSLDDLAASIKSKGVLEPVSLRTHPQQAGRFVVNRGERRVRASRRAGLPSVPSFIDERVDPYAQAIENLQREDLSPFDLARFIAEREAEGESRAEIARKLHKSASFITEAAALADAPAEVRAAFESGRVRDTRVLYELARGLRDDPGGVACVFEGNKQITREVLGGVRASRSGNGDASEGGQRRVVQATKVATALLVEHAGVRGRLSLAGHSGKRTGQVAFENGSRRMVELAELKVIAWTVR